METFHLVCFECDETWMYVPSSGYEDSRPMLCRDCQIAELKDLAVTATF